MIWVCPSVCAVRPSFFESPTKFGELLSPLQRFIYKNLSLSEGGWAGPDYRVAYGRGPTALGPFVKEGVILELDTNVATGAGHHSVFQVIGR